MATNPLHEQFDIRTIFAKSAEDSAKTKNNMVIDSNWIRSRFVVPDSDLDDDVLNIRYSSIASLKFTNTGIGENIFVNPRPQFNPLTDPKADNDVLNYSRPNLNPNQTGTGMGEGYSRLIDDNQQVVFLEFGLPKFNSLLDFFFRAVDYTDSVLANTGRPSTFYNIGQVIGTGFTLVAFPILSVTIAMGKFALTALAGDSSLKYYYFQPHMHMYWSTVNTILTQLVTEQGLLSPVFMPDSNSGSPNTNEIGVPMKLSQTDIDNLNELIPGVISPDTNYIDVFAIVTKSQRAAIKQKEIIYNKFMNNEMDEFNENNADNALLRSKYPGKTIMDDIDHHITFGDYVKEINSKDDTKGDSPKDKPMTDTTATTNANEDTKFMRSADKGTYTVKEDKERESTLDRFVKTFDSSLRQGGAFAVFAVDYTGSTSESFSNSTTNIDIGDKAKQISNRSRALSYDMARGNFLGDNGFQDVLDATKDVIMGTLNGATFGLTNVIQSLTGNAFIEIPKRWDDSSMSFQKNTYTMQLISPYNSFLSQLQNIYLPLCMLLGGVLPLATGKSSYTSPYLCTLFSKGLENIRLGMITDVSITRGTSNLGFDKKRNPLAIDVSFSVTDFSTLVTSPVNSSIFSNFFNITMEDDTPLGNYISVLGGRDILTNKYSAKRVGIRLSRRMMQLEQTYNTDRFGLMLGQALEDSLGAFVSARALPTLYNK